VILATVWVLATAPGCSRPPAQPRPNIVLLSVDTLAFEALRAFAPDAAPNDTLDRFASGARRFPRAWSTASWTLPSHASLVTGLYPDRHGAIARSRAIPADVPTLAELLSDAGFVTVGFTDGGFLHRRYGFARGFDRYNRATGDGTHDDPVPGLPKDGRWDRDSPDLFARAIAFLERRDPADPPFFLFLQTYAVHDYFKLHDWTRERVPASAHADPDRLIRCLVGRETASDEEWELLEALYAAEVANLDRAFAALYETLDQEGLLPSTHVVLVSDHGEGFDPERERIHHGGRLHADQIRVPLLIAGPGIAPGEDRTTVSLVDVAPTLLELAGLPVPPDLDGRPFADRLDGEGRHEDRPLFAMEHHYVWRDGKREAIDPPPETPLLRAVIDGDLCYLATQSGEALYDTASDPRHARDLAPLDPRTDRLRRTALGRDHRPPVSVRGRDPEVEAQLEALGYGEKTTDGAPDGTRDDGARPDDGARDPPR